MVNKANSARNVEAARWIDGFLRRHGVAPKLDEMAAAWGVKKTAAHHRMKILSRLGLVYYRPYQHQTVQTFVPDKLGGRRAYFELKPAMTISQVETTELRYICDE
jgi:hypothetical protein